METLRIVQITVNLFLIGLLIADLIVNYHKGKNRIQGRTTTQKTPEHQTSLEDVNEVMGKSSAKDAMKIWQLEKAVRVLAEEKIINRNTINILCDLNDELSARVRELEGKPKLNNKPVKTTSKNATSGK